MFIKLKKNKMVIKVLLAISFIAASGCSSVMVQKTSKLHSQFEYISDWKQYGKTDYWAASTRGDCEDFALELQDRLFEHGISSDVVKVKTQSGEDHAVLEAKGLVMDNKSATPRMWHETGYKRTGVSVDETIHEAKPTDAPFVTTKWGLY